MYSWGMTDEQHVYFAIIRGKLNFKRTFFEFLNPAICTKKRVLLICCFKVLYCFTFMAFSFIFKCFKIHSLLINNKATYINARSLVFKTLVWMKTPNCCQLVLKYWVEMRVN